MEWPKTVANLAEAWSCDPGALRDRLSRLGVVHDLDGLVELVFPDEFHAALSKGSGRRPRPGSRRYHIERIRRWLHREGCRVEPDKLGDKRSRDVYKVSSLAERGDAVGIKIQVVSSLQRDKWVNFNLDADVLDHGRVHWIIMVAAALAPGNTDFIERRVELKRKIAGPQDEEPKSSYSYLVSATTRTEQHLDQHVERMMLEIHGDRPTWEACRRDAANTKGVT